ncbi:MAG: ethylbenzene dehydrogenase-related protein [Bryobacteraceae bacterium]
MKTVIVSVIAGIVWLAGCQRAPVRTNEVVIIPARSIPLNPVDPVWDSAPEHLGKLLPQDLVEPRQLKATTPEVRVRSVTSGSDVAFRLEWTDPTQSDMPGPSRFLDGCAIQIPKTIEPNPPDPQMGQPGHAVEISFWRADWQASFNGRKDTIREIYPNAAIDHYPYEAKTLEPGSAAQKEMATRYAPSQAVGNRRVGPRESPVEEMIAEGPGTLSPATSGKTRGAGVRTKDGWAVVIARKLPEGLAPNTRSQIALAIWEGSGNEVGARKMRTGWIPLAMRAGK